MMQLHMMKLCREVKPYPLCEGYHFRNIDSTSHEDILAWAEVCSHGLGSPDPAEKQYEDCITNTPGLIPEKDVFFVVDDATDEVVATLTAHIKENGDGNIHMVAAKESVRGKKIGHAMLARGLQRLAEEGVYRTTLTTDDHRLPAVKNYLAAGFLPVYCDTDMIDRWTAVMDKLGWTERNFITKDGEPYLP